MDFFLEIFRVVLYQPLLNALILLYENVPLRDFGIAVVLLTVGIRLLFYPLSAKATRAQKRLTELQPKVKELQKKYKDDREKQARALLDLYRQENINPFASIAPILIQLPILIALYHLFLNGFGAEQLDHLYGWVTRPEVVDTMSLGIVDLGEQSLAIALAAGVFQFFQAKQMMPKGKSQEQKEASDKSKKNEKGPADMDFASMMRKQMLYVFPVIVAVIAYQLPSAVGLYWMTTNIFSIWQYWFVNRKASQPQGASPASS